MLSASHADDSVNTLEGVLFRDVDQGHCSQTRAMHMFLVSLCLDTAE